MIKTLLLLWAIPALATGTGTSSDEFTYQNRPVLEIIRDIEARTPWRFLYRDALLAGKRVSFSANGDDLFEQLERELLSIGVFMRADPARYQVFLFERRRSGPEAPFFEGRVVDAETGGSLPFANIQWESDGRFFGAAANNDGVFRIGTGPLFKGRDLATLTISYVGYVAERIEVGASTAGRPITIRLRPLAYTSGDVVITGAFAQTGADTLWAGINATSSGYGFGGQNAIRTLGVLPSVGVSGGFTAGLNVRGGKSDAMDILLDGITIYNHHHFFGLMDAFNPDVLRAVGFYYNIAPAHFSGPPGATLSFLTRTGSQRKFSGSAGVSSTAIRGSLEGPVSQGTGSWLVSGRYSLIGDVDWLGNQNLLQWGLDINRPNSSIFPESRMLVVPKDGHGRFHDIHVKGYYEFNGGKRLTISGYSGGNSAWQVSDRVFRVTGQGSPQQQPRLEIREVSTANDWGNHAVSVRFQQPLTPSSYLTSTAGFSWYEFEYHKDDFTYSRALPSAGGLQVFAGPFSNSNSLLNMSLSQLADIALPGGGMLSAGHAFHQYRVSYAEENAFNPAFDQIKLSWQWDHFVHYTGRISPELEISGGLRTHFFSDGGYFRLSPRAELTLHASDRMVYKAGYSRNYQFLHSLGIDQYVMSDFWVISNKKYGPAHTDNLIAGVYLRPARGHFLQAEAYVKLSENIRLPKINARALSSEVDFEETPWFNTNSAVSKGIEFLYRASVSGQLDITAGYSVSETVYRNRFLNQGREYKPEWDRTHQLHVRGDWRVAGPLSGYAGATYATGAANPLNNVLPQEPERTGSYFRVDAGMAWKHLFSSSALEIRVNVFNLFDRQNPLYRKQLLFVTGQGQSARLQSELVDVYDLGIMPSFDILIRF